ncbi:MAG: hypothetical protein ABSG31_06390 [Tepidisphaeraceae bacterium]|jgi:tetratricopeptide (TPR) repeat protein
MRIRPTLILSIALGMFCVNQAMADDSAPPDGSLALAEQFYVFAHQRTHGNIADDVARVESAALMRAAYDLAPKEPRFARELYQDLLQLGDTKDALDILNAYRKLEPADEVAQVQALDIYLSEKQSADEQLKMLHQIIRTEQIPPAVRSEAAVRAARLLLNKAENAAAIKMLDTALVDNPANVAALDIKYSLLPPNALPAERVQLLLRMVKANPGNSWAMSRIGQELADQGMIPNAGGWYEMASKISVAVQQLPDAMFNRSIGTELFIGDQTDLAATALGEYCTTAPDDADGWFSYLSVLRYNAGQDKDNKDLQTKQDAVMLQASNAIGNHLAVIRQQMGDATATTRPIDSADLSPLPDFSGDLQLLKTAGNVQLGQSYTDAMASLAWFELYYKHDTDSADKILDVLGKLLQDSDAQLVRLQGWRQYIGGDSSTALTKFKSVSDQDPLAALGAILIEVADTTSHDQAIADAKRLASKYPSGPIGVTLMEQFKPMGIKIESSPQSDSLAAVLNDFPIDSLQILQSPESFYSLQLQPTKSNYDFAEPIFVILSIRNLSSFPLSIGDRGCLHPMVNIDGFLRVDGQPLPNITTVPIDERLVLQPGQVFTTTVRLDSDLLYSLLAQYPQRDFILNLTATTNPQTVGAPPGQQAAPQPGPMGQTQAASEMLERNAALINTNDGRTQLTNELGSPDGDLRFRALQAMSLVALEVNVPNMDANTVAVAKDFINQINKETKDDSVAIRSWSKYLIAMCTPPDQQAAVLIKMSQDADWETRLLALLASRVMPQTMVTQMQNLAVGLESDKEPLVATLARGVVEEFHRAATQPSAAPPMTPSSPEQSPATEPSAEAPLLPDLSTTQP